MAAQFKYEMLVDGIGRDYKHAMKECERKIKKTPKDPPLLVSEHFTGFESFADASISSSRRISFSSSGSTHRPKYCVLE